MLFGNCWVCPLRWLFGIIVSKLIALFVHRDAEAKFPVVVRSRRAATCGSLIADRAIVRYRLRSGDERQYVTLALVPRLYFVCIVSWFALRSGWQEVHEATGEIIRHPQQRYYRPPAFVYLV